MTTTRVVRKECASCHKKLPLSRFGRLHSTVDGLQQSCKRCKNSYKRDLRSGKHVPTIRMRKRANCWTAEGKKICSICKEAKGQEDYSGNFRYPRSACKKCQAVTSRARAYGLTVEELQSLLEKQSGVCGICTEDFPKGKSFVDHDHETGEVRGLLCQTCNAGLGMFYDDPINLQRAISYLQKGRG